MLQTSVCLCVCMQTAMKQIFRKKTKARKKGRCHHKDDHSLQTLKPLLGLNLLTFKTFQLFGQVFFIPVFLVFQVFLTKRKRGEQMEGD